MIEKLFEAINNKNMAVVELMEVFGKDHWYIKNELRVLAGMQDAFEVIAGHSYTEHLLASLSA